jgi:hypothetical protein
MKIISHLTAVTVVEASWEEIRPQHGAAFLHVVNALQQRYQFQSTGHSEVSQNVGLTTPLLAAGQFEFDGAVVPLNQLEFQPSRVVISCSTTEQTLRVAEDLFSFLHADLGFRLPPHDRPKVFVTSIVSDFDGLLDTAFERWTTILQLLKGPGDVPMVPFGVRFMGLKDGALVPDRQFVFERRAPHPPGTTWMFSQAPLDTQRHVALLQEIERAFKG